MKHSQVIFVDESLNDIPHSHISALMDMCTGYIDPNQTRLIVGFQQEERIMLDENVDYFDIKKEDFAVSVKKRQK